MAQTSRFRLQNELVEILGTNNVYYQPPENVKIGYPCIIYELSRIKSDYADNRSYKLSNSYTMTYITNDPDDGLVRTFLEHFKYCSFDRVFRSDNLYHNVFTLYF